MAPSPGEHVFAIPELLEQILLRTARDDEPAHLQVATQLFGLLQVNRTFHDTITKSPVLREQMTTPKSMRLSPEKMFGVHMPSLHPSFPKVPIEIAATWAKRFGRCFKKACDRYDMRGSFKGMSWMNIKVNPDKGDCVCIRTCRRDDPSWSDLSTTRETTWGDLMRWRDGILRRGYE